MTIREAIAECVSQLKNKRADHTIRSYSDGFDVFLEYLGAQADLPIADLTPQHFIDYPTWLVSKYENKRTALSRESAAKYLRDWLVHKRHLDWDFTNETDYKFAKRDAFSEREYPLPKVIPSNDIQRAIAFVPEMHTYNSIERSRNVAMIYLMATSGIRIAEVAALKVKDVQLKDYKIYVRKGKGKKTFFSPISQDAAEAIQVYWDEREWSAPDDPAFARHDKRAGDMHSHMTTQAIQYMIRELRKQAGIPGLTAHKFRHDVGTKVAKEFGLQTASQWLHHSSMETTKGYSHILDEDVMDAADKIYPKTR